MREKKTEIKIFGGRIIYILWTCLVGIRQLFGRCLILSQNKVKKNTEKNEKNRKNRKVTQVMPKFSDKV